VTHTTCFLSVVQVEGLKVTDVVVLIDREQGGEAHLQKNGLALHAAFKLSQLLDVLVKHEKVCGMWGMVCLCFGPLWMPCRDLRSSSNTVFSKERKKKGAWQGMAWSICCEGMSLTEQCHSLKNVRWVWFLLQGRVELHIGATAQRAACPGLSAHAWRVQCACTLATCAHDACFAACSLASVHSCTQCSRARRCRS